MEIKLRVFIALRVMGNNIDALFGTNGTFQFIIYQIMQWERTNWKYQ